MAEPSLAIEIVKTKDLAGYVDRPGILDGQVVPICRLRAAAHAANPSASPDDPALIVATRDDTCVGYLGLMAGEIRVDGAIRKIFWYSTWYSAPGPEGQGVGGVLVHASLRLGVDIATTGLDPKTFFSQKNSFLGLISVTADAAQGMVENNDFSGNQCSLNTHVAAIEHIVRLSKDARISARFPKELLDNYKRALDAGLGDKELPAVFQTLTKE